VQWLFISVVLSVVLTVLLNVALRMFPDASDRAARRLAEFATPNLDDASENDRRVRVFVPWKAMIIGSVILTIVINVVIWMIG
jgi:hypothetical protein